MLVPVPPMYIRPLTDSFWVGVVVPSPRYPLESRIRLVAVDEPIERAVSPAD